ncbi:hypothetical protein C2E23DRAFT_882330 [Lenzites betulinus]|nr:hypothetical protein C2E23DRAFT_882330 [Lenzites betulinus]
MPIHSSLRGFQPLAHSRVNPISTSHPVASALASPHLRYLSDLQQGVDACLVLLFFCLWRPRAICSWMRADVLSRRSIALLVLDAAKEALLYSAWDTKYCGAVVAKFLTAPWNCPEDRAKLAHLKHARKRGGMVHPGPTPDGMVRVKWYPDVEAPLRYPSGLGELWMHLPLESDGRLDLRRLKRAWGMENCFAMYTGPGRRIRVGPQPDEQLSAIAWTVALGSNAVLGVIECPSPSTQEARRGRALLKGVPRATLTVGRLMLSHVFWIGATLLALPVLVVLRMIQLPARFAGLVLLCVLGVPLAAVCLVGRHAWRAYGRLRLSLERAWRSEILVRVSTWTVLPSPAARESAKEWLGWVASGVLVWTVAIAEALLLTARDIEGVERRARDARRRSGGSEISVDDDEDYEEAEE